MAACREVWRRITRSLWCNAMVGCTCNKLARRRRHNQALLQTNDAMNLRTTLTAGALIACLGSVWAVLAQRQQLATLQAEGRSLTSDREDNSAASTQGQSQTATQPSTANSEELLRLRDEVTRLNARKRGLAGVTQENERLKSQLESSRTNAQAANQLPPGYIRRTQAQFAGYRTPEDTFQSFLTALRKHDTAMLLRSLTPDAAQKLEARLQDPDQAKEFFKNMDGLPGLAIENRKDQPDGSLQFDVEIGPGIPKETMSLQLVSGEWKLEPPF
jgi:hypothetical protein